MNQTQSAKDKYQQLVKEVSPNSHLFTDCLKAFFVGGIICDIGQLIINTCVGFGLSKDESGMIASITLIFIAILLTGIGVYEKIGHFAGAGSIVPITGFANSVAAPAIEFKKEGFIVGVGAKMFLIAGPVILYGTLASIVVGIFYYIMK